MKLHYAWIIALTCLSVGMTSIGFARFGYGVILPNMKEGLNLSYAQMGIISTANFIGYSLFTLVGGLIVSWLGYRKLITISLLAVSLSMILTGFSQTFESAVIFRFLTGLGSGGANIPRMALTALWFDRSIRGLAMGVLHIGDGLGIAVGSWIITKILETYGVEAWKYSWYILGLTTIVSAVLGYVLLRDRPGEMGLLPKGREGCPRKEEGTSISNDNLVNPFRSSTLYHLGVIYSIFGFTFIIYSTFFTSYVQYEIGLTDDLATQLWSIVGIVSIGSGFIWGSISDRIGRGWGLALVYLNLSASFLLLIILKNLFGSLLSAISFGLALLATPTIVNAAISDYFGTRQNLHIMAFISTVFLGGGTISSPWIAGYITDLLGSFTPIFTVSAVLLMAGSILALGLKNSKSGRKET